MSGFLESWRAGAGRFRAGIVGLPRNEDVILTVLSILVGAAAGYGAVGFRWFIGIAQTVFFGAGEERLTTIAGALPWWQVLLAPAAGGLLIGLLVRYVMPGGRPVAVAEVIEAADRHGGKMSLTQGLWAAFISATSIGAGASVGREGPVVHLGASMASWIARRLRLSQNLSVYLLGCGVAAAVSASFNAPLAGALFAQEVVIRHYRLRAFAPVVLASVTGTLISRSQYGDFPAFMKPEYQIVSFWEFPAFAILGILSAVIALLMIEAVKQTHLLGEATRLPTWARPAAAGLAVGGIGIAFPQVLGVGYEATDMVLGGNYGLWLLIAVAAARIVTTGLSLGGGFGGGIFSPSLVVGAFTGAAFGTVAAMFFPDLASGRGAYALVGMGAVASAVLGAPISTILIIFELTGDYAVTIAVMVAVVLSSLVVTQFGPKSYFHWQLRQRGAAIDEDMATRLMRARKVGAMMVRDFATAPSGTRLVSLRDRVLGAPHGELYITEDGGRFAGTLGLADLYGQPTDPEQAESITAGDIARTNVPILTSTDTLEDAIQAFTGSMESHIPVLNNEEDRELVGVLHHRDVLLALERIKHQAAALEVAAGER